MNQIKPIEKTFLSLLGSVITQQAAEADSLSALSETQWQQLVQLGYRHKVTAILLEGLTQLGNSEIPAHVLERLTNSSITQVYAYYHQAKLTGELLTLQKEHQIKGVLLKGIGLSALYPKEDIRKSNDVDIYLWEEDSFQKFRRLLLKEGYEELKSKASHHIELVKHMPDKDLLVELHYKIAGTFDNPLLDDGIEHLYRNLDGLLDEERVMDITVPVLEPTLNALYLLLHMLRHFIYKGFGVRLLCDWMVFLINKADKIDHERLWNYIKDLKLETFSCMITSICISCFGFSSNYFPHEKDIQTDEELLESFLSDILNGGDLGKYDRSRIRCNTEPDGKRSFPPIRIFKEIHKQMLLRYPKPIKYKVIWPVLWCATVVIFFYEIRTRNKTSMGKIMKSYRKRNQLYQKLYKEKSLDP